MVNEAAAKLRDEREKVSAEIEKLKGKARQLTAEINAAEGPAQNTQEKRGDTAFGVAPAKK